MRKSITLFIIAIALATMAKCALAAELKVIELQQRSAEEVIPIIAPFVSPDGTLSGTGYQLIIRTDADNLKQLEEIIQRLDKAPRQLLVSVRQGGDAVSSHRGGSVSGAYQDDNTRVQVGENGRSDSRGLSVESADNHLRGRVRIYSTGKENRNAVAQRLRVMEGQWAYIQSGVSVPVAKQTIIQGAAGATVQQGIEYKDVSSGFEVRPRISGERVILDIKPYTSKLSRRGGGMIDTQQVSTTISGLVGEWIEVGGVAESEQRSGSGTIYSTKKKNQVTNRVYLKVELIP